MDDRRQELLKLFDGADEAKKTVCDKLIDEAVFLESRLEYLKKYPHMRVHPENPELQKQTFAGKQYKEYLQQYVNVIRTLFSMLNKNANDEEESPLRTYLKGFNK